jgi:hypothetical protein
MNKITLANILPRGSGIDSYWYMSDMKNGKVKVSNSYHCMNDGGYYDGYADFTIIVDRRSPLDFKLQFNGDTAQYKNRKYLLRECLEDTIYYAIQNGIEKNETFDCFPLDCQER